MFDLANRFMIVFGNNIHNQTNLGVTLNIQVLGYLHRLEEATSHPFTINSVVIYIFSLSVAAQNLQFLVIFFFAFLLLKSFIYIIISSQKKRAINNSKIGITRIYGLGIILPVHNWSDVVRSFSNTYSRLK